jgi:hypothetical protein
MHNNLSFKLLSTVFVLTCMVLLINGCDNEKDAAPKQVTTQSIGNEGGELKGSDGILTLAIPDGAITTETKVGIEVTSEVAANGIGKVYTLTPEGTEFEKPISVSFQYTDEDIKDISPARLAIAFKKEDNTWRVMRTLSSDNTTKTVTTETTHFSQWSLIDGAPFITGIDPLTAQSNEITTISIVGVNFSETFSENIVTLNGFPLEVVAATSTTLMVMLPAGGSTGKINVEVNGNVTESIESLTILKALPTITGFSPASAVEDFDTNITITGTNFSSVPAENTVTLNGVTLTVFSATNTALSVLIPAGLTSGKLKVSVNDEEVTSTDSFTVIDTTPVITGFSPTSANDDVTTTVMISGINFSKIVSENVVTLNGAVLIVPTITFNTASEMTLMALIPPGNTTGQLVVVVNGKTAVSTDNFTVISTTPTITGFSPDSGIEGLDTSITITGTNFSTTGADNLVSINGVSLIVTSASSTQLSVIVPSSARTGLIKVTVNGKSAVSDESFMVVKPKPIIESFSPTSGSLSIPTNVSITGMNFSPVLSENSASLNGVQLTVVSATNTALVVTVPAGASSGRIQVSVSGVTVVSSSDFTVN